MENLILFCLKFTKYTKRVKCNITDIYKRTEGCAKKLRKNKKKKEIFFKKVLTFLHQLW